MLNETRNWFIKSWPILFIPGSVKRDQKYGKKGLDSLERLCKKRVVFRVENVKKRDNKGSPHRMMMMLLECRHFWSQIELKSQEKSVKIW